MTPDECDQNGKADERDDERDAQVREIPGDDGERRRGGCQVFEGQQYNRSDDDYWKPKEQRCFDAESKDASQCAPG